MKRILFIIACCFAYILNAQTLSYNDIGVLLSKNNISGTARYNAMSGAFGALGGNLSALEINPAGGAVFTHSEFAISLGMKNIETTSSFLGNNNISKNEQNNLSQAGGVFIFKNGYHSNWGKTAVAINYSNANNYNNQWSVQGNSGYAPITDLYDYKEPVIYTNSDGQSFKNTTNGKKDKYTFTLASEYNKNLSIGASLNTYNIEFHQQTVIEEFNNDGNGNTLNISQLQELTTYGEGVSFNFGMILKPIDNIRLGIAYQSPTWFTLSENFLKFDDTVNESNNALNLTPGNSGVKSFDYNLKSPSNITGSLAYIFNKKGLISLDYVYKNYSNLNISNTPNNNADFNTENNSFKNDLKSIGTLRIGTEWLIKNFSVRGGYHFEKSPYKDAINSEDIKGFSFGAGFKFNGGKIDFSYLNSTKTAPYNIYGSLSSQVKSAELDYKISKFTATLVLSL